jgi:hypothetical protein
VTKKKSILHAAYSQDGVGDNSSPLLKEKGHHEGEAEEIPLHNKTQPPVEKEKGSKLM